MNRENLGKKQIILLVDDELLVRWSLSRSLSKQGFEVYTAATAQESIVIMEQEKVDWLITDLKMPGMDGIGLLKKIKSEFPSVKMILMTAYGSSEIEKEVQKLGAIYFNKPFDVEMLISTITRESTMEERLSNDS